jgi:serine/threonine protein kinase
VLIGYDGAVKLIDFGVAKAVGKMVRTQHGMIKGKYGYMSPEQMRGERLDRRSDIFSLGVLTWELLTLCRLYNAANEFDTFRMITEEEPVPPSELRGDVPADLDRIVVRCLAKHPDDRYATCAALLADVESLHVRDTEARRAIGSAARESMPERLRWIEKTTGQRIADVDPTRRDDGDDASRESTDRELAALEGPTTIVHQSQIPPPRRPVGVPPPQVPPQHKRPARASPLVSANDPDTARGDTAPSARRVTTQPIPTAPTAPAATIRLSDDDDVDTAPAHVNSSRPPPPRATPVLYSPDFPTDAPPTRRGLRVSVLLAALGSVAVCALLIGLWLGSR